MSGFEIISRQDSLRSFRVRIRNEIARQEQLLRWKSGDAVDGQRRLAALQLQLRSTEREWRELEGLLGRPHPAKPVKLDAPARPRSATIRSAGPVYLNRALGSR
ncbi:MAG: hypothetical protein K0R41_2378 [Geminicoccaceae bacterium]|jgi:predicted metal-dependent phosphoesterase TrpH|nr:hypothetical protein [Geminicoccaceae bacterium]